MTLQASGAISLQDIEGEFGGSAPTSLSEYYGSDTAPSSGEISLFDFYGLSNYTPTHTVTEGQDGTYYGFIHSSLAAGPIGSVSPTTFQSVAMMYAYYKPSETKAQVGFSGNLGQSWFTSVQFEDGAVLSTSGATYFWDNFNDISGWYWTEAKPARWDGTGTSGVLFI
jgi:hypothetical protein